MNNFHRNVSKTKAQRIGFKGYKTNNDYIAFVETL